MTESPTGAQSAPVRPAHPRHARLRRIVPLVLACLLVAWLGIGSYRALGSAVHARALLDDLRTLWADLSTDGRLSLDDLSAARAQAGYLTQDLGGLQRWAAPVACPLADLLEGSGAGRLAVLACDGLSLASGLASLVHTSLQAIEQDLLDRGVNADPMQTGLASLAVERAQLEALIPAATRLESATEDLQGMPGRAGQFATLAPAAVHALLVAPSLLAGEDPHTLLIVLQNSDELRATGGFIGSVAVVVLRGGHITSLQYLNSYDVEPEGAQMPDAPAPLAEYMDAPGMVFRDGNWSPDFPTSAAVLAALYSTHRGPVDAIVAVDTELLENVLYAIGPVDVPMYGVTLSSDNLLQMAETYWENPLEGAALSGVAAETWEWSKHRKDFGGDFIEAGRAHLGTMGFGTWLDLAKVLLTSVQERHLQLWAAKPQAQADIDLAGWSGSLDETPGDYVMVVDSNVGFNKVDRRIERDEQYQLGLTDGLPTVTLTLTYTNTATVQLQGCERRAQAPESYEALTQQCYWDYVRVLVPRGAAMQSVQGTTYPIDQGVEAGLTSVGTLIIVPPGETVTLRYTYTLPSGLIICSGRWCELRLTVQKQPGTHATPLTVSLDPDVVPGGTRLAGDAGYSEQALKTDLLVDREFVLRWASDSD